MSVKDLTILDDAFRDALGRSIGTDVCTQLDLPKSGHTAATGAGPRRPATVASAGISDLNDAVRPVERADGADGDIVG